MMQFNRPIWKAGFATVITTFQLVILENYIIIFLKEDLVTAIMVITIIISLRNLLQLFLRVPLGELSQIIGRKPLLVSGHICFILSLISAAFADNWVWILISTVFMAIGMSAFWGNLFAFIGDVAPDSSGGNLGRIFQMADVGSIFGLILASFLLKELLWGLKEIFGIVAIIAIISGIVNIIILPETLDEEHRKRVPSIPKALIASFFTMLSSLIDMTRRKNLTRVFFFQYILSFIEFTATTFLPLLIVEKGFSRGDVSEIGMWAILVIVWFKPYLGRLTDRFNFNVVITLTTTIYCLGLLVCTTVPDNSVQSYWLFVLLFIILNASLITAYMAESSQTSKAAPVSFRGTAQGALGFYVSLGRATSTVVLGPIWELIGLIGVFFFAAILVLIIMTSLWIIGEKRKNHRNQNLSS